MNFRIQDLRFDFLKIQHFNIHFLNSLQESVEKKNISTPGEKMNNDYEVSK